MNRLFHWLASKLSRQSSVMPDYPVTPPRNPNVKPRFMLRTPGDDAVDAERLRDRIEYKRQSDGRL